MKLEEPITIPDITDIEVVDSHYDRVQGALIVDVHVKDERGAVVQALQARLTAMSEVTRKRGDGESTTEYEGGQCNIIQRSPRPTGTHDQFQPTSVSLPGAFEKAMKARKEDDEHTALEVAGVRDGWLRLE